MDVSRQEISKTLIDGVSNWLRKSALNGSDLETITYGICERLSAIGIPLARVHVSFSMLHPLYTALSFTWRRGQAVKVEGSIWTLRKPRPNAIFPVPTIRWSAKT